MQRIWVRLFLALALLPVAPPESLAASVYRWVDGQGVAHYSDRPNPGAERIEIRTPNIAPGRPVVGTASPNEDDVEFAGYYSSLTILSPSAGQVLWNIGGQLDAEVTVEPGIRRNHALVFLLDGAPVATVTSGATLTRLGGVFRGEHTLRAQIQDSDGQVLMQSPPTTFVVQQTSIANPQRAAPVPTPRPRP